MDSDPSVTCKPSNCQLGILHEEAKEVEMTDEETFVDGKDIEDGQQGENLEDTVASPNYRSPSHPVERDQQDVSHDPVCRSDCQWPIPLMKGAAPKKGLSRIGQYGLGAWRVGMVTTDVILDKI